MKIFIKCAVFTALLISFSFSASAQKSIKEGGIKYEKKVTNLDSIFEITKEKFLMNSENKKLLSLKYEQMS